MIAAVENAIAERVLAASEADVLGYRLRKVAVYAGEFDDELRTVIRSFPAVWVAFRSLARGERAAGESWRVPATFSVFVGTTNRRNQKARRHGSDGGVGSLQIVKDVRGLIIGQCFGLDIEPFSPGAVTGLVNSRTEGAAASIYACEFDTAWFEEAGSKIADADLDDFEAFHVDWDVPPLGNVTPPLPSDDADATDTVTLETD